VANRNHSEYADALAFFGLGAAEPLDPLVLRSRKFNKERATRDPEEKEQIRRYYQILTEEEVSTPAAPAAESPAPAPPAAEARPSPPKARSAIDPETRVRKQEELEDVLPRIVKGIHRLHHDEVINNTFGLMVNLQRDLHRLVLLLQDDVSWLADEDKNRLRASLTSLYSSLIIGALHKHELSVTNDVIRKKNAALTALGVAIPFGHDEIDPRDYKYSW
jgi:hypothetical protein